MSGRDAGHSRWIGVSGRVIGVSGRRVLAIGVFLLFHFFAEGQNDVLWYTYPATYWNSQALHLGNGFMGASFFGGVDTEKIALTEGSVWSGGPAPATGDWTDYGVNPNANKYLGAIRRAVVAGQLALADSLTSKYYLGDNKHFGSFTSIGDILLVQDSTGKPYTNYRRELDLQHAVGEVRYDRGGVRYSREYFCSYPGRVLAIKMRASGPAGALNMLIGMTIMQKKYTVTVTGNTYTVDGWIDEGKRKFRVTIMAIPYGGMTMAEGSRLRVSNADSLVLLVYAGTDYRLHWPDYQGEDPAITGDSIIAAAAGWGYDKLKRGHVADYNRLYERVRLDLGGDSVLAALPTNERWARMREGKEDLGLKEVAFNLGRYLIISSSRPGTLPANLQGKWNSFYRSPWAGNYQSNINIQEIYWSCGPMDLGECGEPYVDWIRDLVEPGREIARRVYGTTGWVSHTTGNIYGNAAPTGGISYGVYPMATVWHCRHLWDQFSYSMDTAYLRRVAYPIIREAVRFWLLNLVPFQGHVIVAPSVSAEHGAFLAGGERTFDGTSDIRSGSSVAGQDRNRTFSADSYGAVRYNIPGPSQDAEMLRDLFSICVEAAGILHRDAAFCDSVRAESRRLLPFRIGRYGQLQEWWEDLDTPSVHHRHIAALYAVAPADQIDPYTTPKLAAAARVSLNMRGDIRYPDDEASGGNWSRAWRIWCWARLLDGNRADSIFTQLLTDEGFENLLTFQHAGYHWNRKDFYRESDSLYLHYQLDASASTPGFMAEFLLQSHLGELDLLPALPDAWRRGSITGLKARGGYSVDIYWKDGRLVRAVIRGGSSKAPKVRVGGRLVDVRGDKRIEWIGPGAGGIGGGRAGSAHAVIYPAPAGLDPSPEYKVSVDGAPAFVYASPVPAAYCSFDMNGPVTVTIKASRDIKWVDVRPLSAGIRPVFHDSTITVRLTRPVQLSVEVNGSRHFPLFLFANPPEVNKPDSADPNVIWFGAGKIYHPGIITVKSGQTVYVEGGAVVVGVIKADKASHIRVCGRGVLDGSLNSHFPDADNSPYQRFIELRDCEDVRLEDVTLHNSTSWQVVPIHCNRVQIEGLKIVSDHNSDDGMDIVRCRNVMISHCFVRTKDDCIAIKSLLDFPVSAGVDSVMVEKSVFWNGAWGNGLEIGFELNSAAVRDITFRDNDIIHVEDGAVLSIHDAGRATVSHILYDDIRIEDANQKLFDLAIFRSRYSADSSKVDGENKRLYLNGAWDGVLSVPAAEKAEHAVFRGHIEDVVFRNVRVVDGIFPYSVFYGYDRDHAVRNVRIENLVVHGRLIRSLDGARCYMENTDNIHLIHQ